MSDPLGIRPIHRVARSDPPMRMIEPYHPLRRVLAFTRRSIDDVINNPIARNEVRAYFKLHKFIQREGEISDLERQWNSTPL